MTGLTAIALGAEQDWQVGAGEHSVRLHTSRHDTFGFDVKPIGCLPGWEGSFGRSYFELSYQ